MVCDGPRQILAAVNWFLNNTDPRLPAMPIVRVKNKFSMEDASEYDGYRDLMICVIHTGKKGLRIIGEIQFHDAKLHALKVKVASPISVTHGVSRLAGSLGPLRPRSMSVWTVRRVGSNVWWLADAQTVQSQEGRRRKPHLGGDKPLKAACNQFILPWPCHRRVLNRVCGTGDRESGCGNSCTHVGAVFWSQK